MSYLNSIILTLEDEKRLHEIIRKGVDHARTKEMGLQVF